MTVHSSIARCFGASLGVALLWFCTIAWFIPGYMRKASTEVYIYDGCIGTGTVTVFTCCMLQVVVAAWFIRKYFLPALFGDARWESFDELKRQKLIGFIAQIIVRSAVMVQLLKDVWPQFTFEEGLFHNFNSKAEYDAMKLDQKVRTCATIHMSDSEVTAMQSWVLAKYHMCAVHMWELAFIPGLTIDGWLHHLFVVLVATVSSQPESLTGSPYTQPYIDLIGYFFILGASLNWAVKSCVVMYHYSAPVASTQARYMLGSTIGAAVILIVFYTGIPLYVSWRHAKTFGPKILILMAMLPILFLFVVEARLIKIKAAIVRNSWAKATIAAVAGTAAFTGTDQLEQDAEISPEIDTEMIPRDAQFGDLLSLPKRSESGLSRELLKSSASSVVSFSDSSHPSLRSLAVLSPRAQSFHESHC